MRSSSTSRATMSSKAPPELTNDPRLEHLDRSVEELELSVRSYNCLRCEHPDHSRTRAEERKTKCSRPRTSAASRSRNQRYTGEDGLALGMKVDEQCASSGRRSQARPLRHPPKRTWVCSTGGARPAGREPCVVALHRQVLFNALFSRGP